MRLGPGRYGEEVARQLVGLAFRILHLLAGSEQGSVFLRKTKPVDRLEVEVTPLAASFPVTTS